MNVEEYRSIVHEDVELAVSASGSSAASEFLSYVTGILINGEEFDDFTDCHYEGITRRNGYMAIDGYSVDETDGSCCLFIVDYHGHSGENSIKSEDINSAFKRIRLFVEEAVRNELYLVMNGSQQAVEFARDLYYDADKIVKYRFFLLTDAYNKQRVKTIKDTEINGKTVELNVWDIERLFDLVRSKIQKESVVIVLHEFGLRGIPCVKAVEYEDAVADIEIPVKFDGDNSEGESSKPENLVTYSSYLAVVPGKILNELYLEYGSKLLEGNVRSFLSVRGKVNKGIQNTIKNYPEMFFAYNNGIAATASEIETEMTAEGLLITKIKDLQIVNGGQTTASITNTVLTAKKNEIIDIDKIFVPMKLSVLEHEMSERIIPKISEYSNSQNKVEASDFFSNHPFHIRMEDFSRKTAIPSKGGNQYQQYWFYERTRGQYNQGKMKFATNSSQMKQYQNRYPEHMVITMLDLAKYMEIYFGNPEVVSRGKQKYLQDFAGKIKDEWDKSNIGFNLLYYKRVVALAILYKKADEIIKQSQWYKDKRSYKANVLAYTLSIIFTYIRKEVKGCELDFNRIWNDQDIYEELSDQVRVLSKEVYDFITGPRETENVTEWCKKDLCWNRAQNKVFTINDDFLDSLINSEQVASEQKSEKSIQKIRNEVDAIKEIMGRGGDYWKRVLEWGKTNHRLTDKEISLIQMAANISVTYRIPTDKQAQAIENARKRLISQGMPMQFLD